MMELMSRFIDCAGKRLPMDRPLVMGILNVTQDSFSDGGQFYQEGRLSEALLLRKAEGMLADGADILDIGGESTRPGADAVSIQQELDRVLSAVALIHRELDVVISVDTSSPDVMTQASRIGAGMLNDVRALQREGALEAAAKTGLPVCLMHMKGQPRDMQSAPEYEDVVEEVISFLERRVEVCVRAGIGRDRLLIDPGFGFGKTLQHNLQLLNRLEALQGLRLPLLVGTSRKSIVGGVLNKPLSERLYGSLATVALAIDRGAWIVRVHDVAATADVVKMCTAVKNESV
jgi:dihydropteroate synthase